MPLAYLPSHCKLSLAPALSRDACWNCFSQDGTRTKLSAWQGNSHSPTEVMLKVVEPLAPAKLAVDAASILLSPEFRDGHVETRGGLRLVIDGLPSRIHGLEPRDALAKLVNHLLLVH
jgi:hypothetical protein